MGGLSKTKASDPAAHGYEFGGPVGALGAALGLPVACYAFTFICNDISGCPVPSTLSPSTLSTSTLAKEVGWPKEGVLGLFSFSVTAWLLAYYGFSLLLRAFLPGTQCEGTDLNGGGKLGYKLNSFNASVVILAIAGAGTATHGADFILWTFIYDNYLHLLSSSMLISYVIATFVYIKSFSVKSGNADKRALADGGQSGNMLYDWFIGRELNPRSTLPIIGEIDIKEWCELCPGFLGWILLDLAFIARQYRTFGYVSDSIVLVTIFQAVYVFDAQWMEPAILTTIDITTDGFGFMLAFGDLVWLPFTYSLQAKYLSVYPYQLGVTGIAGVLAVQATGYYIFRAANNEKNRFRTNPKDPRVAHLQFIETKTGSKLLTSGWWGIARHINYLGDWIMSWSFVLPTGFAGYIVEHSAPLGRGNFLSTTEVVSGSAKGWGMIITYFYIFYFAILLIHRETRDEAKCSRKYGKDWEEYKRRVPSRIIPGIY
ncbi:MAG: erg24, C-14 sterol reductase [Vezdaea aestivalis]|nr:MAG: erg24, C-14 sterol reductase [Vezdaea aestivalis]